MIYYESYRQDGISASPYVQQVYGVVGSNDHISYMRSSINYKALFLHMRAQSLELKSTRSSESDIIIWLYGGTMEYNNNSFDELMYSLVPYKYRMFRSMLRCYNDIDIIIHGE